MENMAQAQAKEQANEQETTETKNEINMDELTDKIREEFKSELSGLNRKISELTKEKQQAEEAAALEAESKLTVAQRLEKMESAFKASQQEAEKAKERAVMTKVAMGAIESAGLPSSLIEKMDISSQETIESEIAFYSELFKGTERAVKDDYRKANAFKPGGGDANTSAPKSLAECKTNEEKIAYFKAKRA
jgi:chromosome segregation ATPase